MPTLEYKHSIVPIGATGAGAIQEHRGIVRGLLSTYDNRDLGGDIVEKGAFADTLRTSGNRRVMLWQHDQKEPLGIGELQDTSRGLEVEVQLDKSIRRAGEALTLSKMGALAFSMGYTVTKKRGGTSGPRYLEAVDLKEGSFVTFPMNLKARILSAKEAGVGAALDELTRSVRRAAQDIRVSEGDGKRQKLRDLSNAIHTRIMKAIATDAGTAMLEALQARIELARITLDALIAEAHQPDAGGDAYARWRSLDMQISNITERFHSLCHDLDGLQGRAA